VTQSEAIEVLTYAGRLWPAWDLWDRSADGEPCTSAVSDLWESRLTQFPADAAKTAFADHFEDQSGKRFASKRGPVMADVLKLCRLHTKQPEEERRGNHLRTLRWIYWTKRSQWMHLSECFRQMIERREFPEDMSESHCRDKLASVTAALKRCPPTQDDSELQIALDEAFEDAAKPNERMDHAENSQM